MNMTRTWLLLAILSAVSALAPPRSSARQVPQPKALAALPEARAASAAAVAVAVAATPLTATAAGPEWVAPLASFLGPALFIVQFAMLVSQAASGFFPRLRVLGRLPPSQGRVLLSWYPEININKLPWNLIAWPTEPILRQTRRRPVTLTVD